MCFKINNTIGEIIQFEKRTKLQSPNKRNPQTKEKKIFTIIEGTL